MDRKPQSFNERSIAEFPTSYINPRTNTNNGNKLINKSKTKHLWMDLLISYLSIFLL